MTADDPFLWLEDIEGPRALAFVKEQNARTRTALEGDPRFATRAAELKAIASAKDRIPGLSFAQGFVYSFWKDETNLRGVWRRAREKDFLDARGQPAWEILLDVDALAVREGESWVWQGAECLRPGHLRCLVSLSKGGKDAAVVREFDITTRRFVQGGFSLPEGKHRVSFVDKDTLLVGADLGPGTLTDSGYPRQARLWKRGTAIESAPVVFEGEQKDVSVDAVVPIRDDGSLALIAQNTSFYTARWHRLKADGTTARIALPEDLDVLAFFRGKVIARLRSDWTLARGTLARGTIVAVSPDAPDAPQALYAPDTATSVDSVVALRNSLVLGVLENVSSKFLLVKEAPGGAFVTREIPVPPLGAASVAAASADSDAFFIRYENLITPPTLKRIDASQDTPTSRDVMAVAPKFDAAHLITTQMWTTSKDGTRVPYFLVHKKGIALDGENPTLLYGYGGFEVSMLPTYSTNVGKAWLERGGVYALANIRGGGEFGPRWHQAALLENRQRAFDDFIAVAEDLAARKITRPRRLGIMGGSNGGLLVGTVMVQRPDLFQAVVCQVPLLDMLRYHRLLAGASWMAEYGDPESDSPAARALRSYSPYQNVKAGTPYPRTLVRTSTKDDRVHPGHARKMVARMLEQGHDVLYFENIEGGHAGAANLEQDAKIRALEFVFLEKQLMD